MKLPRNDIAPPSMPSDLKLSNRTQVLDTFLDGAAHSASEVSAKIGLSRQTVMKSIQFFLQSGLLVSLGKGDSSEQGGKRPELFTLAQDRFFLCVSLWPDLLCIRLYTLGGETIDNLFLTIAIPEKPQDAVSMVCEFVDQMIAGKDMKKEQIISVLVSTSGIVDTENGILKYCALTPEWGTDIPVTDLFRPYFAPSTRIYLDSAVKVIAYPQLSDPAHEGKRIVTMFTSWIVASCFIEDNRIYAGHNSLLGELGHMVVDPCDPEECGCGGHGCLERMIDEKHITALMERNRETYSDSPLFHVPDGKISIPTIFFYAQQEDPLARLLVDYLAGHFATALRNVAVVFDPDIVIFQGEYTFAHSYFDTQLRNNLKSFRYFPQEGPFETVYDARHPVEMGIYGAYLALAHFYFGDPEHYQDSAAAKSR